jgi:hypothetical protein
MKKLAVEYNMPVSFMHGTLVSIKVCRRKQTVTREAFAAKPFQIFKDMDKNCSLNYAGVSTNPT